MPTSTVGGLDLRDENISSVVKGFALQEYTMKDVCMVLKSGSWAETYFIETAADLTGGTGQAVKGIPRGAKFPQLIVNWTETTKRHEKYGGEGTITWEDEVMSKIDVIGRTLLRIARAVAKGVDDEIYSQISTLAGNTVTIAGGDEWDSATIANRDPIKDILNAMKEIGIDNYNIRKNGFLLLNETDYANMMNNPNVKNSGQFYSDTVTSNGTVGRIVGLTVKVSNSVTNDEAIVIVGQEAVTWQSAHALTVMTMLDPLIKKTIRAAEVGVTQVPNPNAICKITNTQKT